MFLNKIKNLNIYKFIQKKSWKSFHYQNIKKFQHFYIKIFFMNNEASFSYDPNNTAP
jgi:hypothetical protein